MCDLRLNSLGEKLCPISLPSPGGGARSEWSSLTGVAHWREPGQTPKKQQVWMDPSVPWASQAPCDRGKGSYTALRETTSQDGVGWRGLWGEGPPPSWVACYQWHFASAIESRELPLCLGLQESWPEPPFPLPLWRSRLDQGKLGL